ncbi:MAG TPA: hypothetical protein VII43_03880 [Opitutaceae bacterium]
MKKQHQNGRNARAMRFVLSLAIGLLIGVFFHYLLYRYSLPSNPFIYAAF